MNDREKIIQAIQRFQTAQDELRAAEKAISPAKQRLVDAEQALCRAMHAVLGERCTDGVLLQGKKYAARKNYPADSFTLEVTHVTCEVLG